MFAKRRARKRGMGVGVIGVRECSKRKRGRGNIVGKEGMGVRKVWG